MYCPQFLATISNWVMNFAFQFFVIEEKKYIDFKFYVENWIDNLCWLRGGDRMGVPRSLACKSKWRQILNFCTRPPTENLLGVKFELW